MLIAEHALTARAMVVVREVLEGMLAPNLAQAVLFDSLDTLQAPPETPEQWLAFAKGPLHHTVTHRVGAVEAAEVSERLETILGALSAGGPPRRRGAEPTARFDRSASPPRVLVLAASNRLARMLKAALGPSVVTVGVSDINSCKEAVHTLIPNIFLVDLTDGVGAKHQAIKSGLEVLPPRTIVLIWDQGTHEGELLANMLMGTGRPVAWVDRREGVDPLLDHIRASQG